MPASLQPVAALAVGASVTFLATPMAARLARRTGFLDRPGGYKKHTNPTAYLGGCAALAGILVAILAVGGVGHHLGAAAAAGAALWVVGTIDDRVSVRPRWRVAVEVATAVGLSAAGAGWSLFSSAPANYLLTIVWVVGIVNAFNLMDNLDGAASTVAATCAVVLAGIAAVHGNVAGALLACAVAGACIGFLPYNLSRPARIFLGDGGSMPIGILIATTAMLVCRGGGAGAANLAAATLAVGLAVFDVTLVIVSRRRRGVPVFLGGRDHLTHRVLSQVGSPQRVALVLAAVQLSIGGLAIGGSELGPEWLAAFATTAVAIGFVALWALESPSLTTFGIPAPARAEVEAP